MIDNILRVIMNNLGDFPEANILINWQQVQLRLIYLHAVGFMAIRGSPHLFVDSDYHTSAI